MTRSVQYKGNKITPELHIGLPPTSLKLTPDSFPKWRTKRCNIGLGYLATRWTWGGGRRNALGIWEIIFQSCQLWVHFCNILHRLGSYHPPAPSWLSWSGSSELLRATSVKVGRLNILVVIMKQKLTRHLPSWCDLNMSRLLGEGYPAIVLTSK